MRRIVIAFLVVVFLLAIAVQSSEAHWRRYSYPYGWYDPFWRYDPFWPSWPYALAPQVVIPQQPVVIQPQPQQYIQQQEPQQQFWYWCNSAQKYHPYVQSCSEGWMQVTPSQAPPSAPR